MTGQSSWFGRRLGSKRPAASAGRASPTRPSRVGAGPTSTKLRYPMACNVAMPAAKSTGRRACRHQYSASGASSQGHSSPVTLLTSGIRGDANRA